MQDAAWGRPSVFFTHMNEIASGLRTLKAPKTDRGICKQMLLRLSADYDDVKGVVEMHGRNDITGIERLTRKIYASLSKNLPPRNLAKALVASRWGNAGRFKTRRASRKGRDSGHSPGQEKKTCFRCQKTDRFIKGCKVPSEKVCFRCDRPGHLKQD